MNWHGYGESQTVRRRNRVAIFLPSLRGGGAERVMVTVANGLAARGFNVDVLLARKEGPYLEEIEPKVNVINLQAKRVLHAAFPLMRYLRNQHPATLLSALGHANLVAILARFFSGSGTRLVVSERSAPSLSDGTSRTSLLFGVLRRWLYPRADSILAVSEGVACALAEELGVDQELIEVVYNPLDIEAISKLSKEENHHPWFDQGGNDVILAVGRLTPVKGYDLLLQAFALLLKRRTAKLIVLGDGPLREKLREECQRLGIVEHVDFVGFQNNPYSWMARSDVYVLSSISEGLPNSLLQAMACGARIVSTDCDFGPSELLENGAWGKLVPVNDAAALGEAMEVSLSMQDAPNVKLRAAQFDVSNIVDEYARAMGLTGRGCI